MTKEISKMTIITNTDSNYTGIKVVEYILGL